MVQLDIKRQEYTSSQLRGVMRTGYVGTFGKEPSAAVLGYGWAVAKLETGGRTINNNFGNVKCFPGCQATEEWVDITPLLPAGSSEYPYQRAYPTGEKGAAHWWKVLRNPNYDGVLELAEQGLIYDAAFLMGERGYYEARKDLYSAKIEELYNQHIAEFGGPPAVRQQQQLSSSKAANYAVLTAGILAGWFGARAIASRHF